MSYRTTRAFEHQEFTQKYPEISEDRLLELLQMDQSKNNRELDIVGRQTLTTFPPDVAEYRDHCPSCLRGSITLRLIGHSSFCTAEKDEEI